MREILDKTDLTPEDRSASTPASARRSRPVTVATYQILTLPPAARTATSRTSSCSTRARLGPDHLRRGPPAARAGLPRHGRDPGAPPARPDRHAGPRGRPRGRRLRLIGPKKYDVPWRELEQQGWIAEATCHEVRVAAARGRSGWSTPSAERRDKYRIASENPVKDEVVPRADAPARERPGPDHRPVPRPARGAGASARTRR